MLSHLEVCFRYRKHYYTRSPESTTIPLPFFPAPELHVCCYGILPSIPHIQNQQRCKTAVPKPSWRRAILLAQGPRVGNSPNVDGTHNSWYQPQRAAQDAPLGIFCRRWPSKIYCEHASLNCSCTTSSQCFVFHVTPIHAFGAITGS